jgi:1,4-alpha-glucan branching enzyme
LKQLEYEDQIFPGFDHRVYQANESIFVTAIKTVQPTKPLILMLSWEFPPRHIGGLGIHVRDLAIELVRFGLNVHILTVAHDGIFLFEVTEGVGVHYIPICQPLELNENFLPWVLQMNVAFSDYGKEFTARLSNKIILHAHDWMVAYAAFELGDLLKTTLVATIHATEYGRNKGIYTPTQQVIHQLEADLVCHSQQVICCSRYMQAEIHNLFGVPLKRLHVIPNGVKPISLLKKALPNHTILYVGRLVKEKGVHHLLTAISNLSKYFPDLKLIIAGDGPYQSTLRKLAINLKIENRVKFKGFISEEVRNQLFSECQVAVYPSLYEPFGIVALEAMIAGIPLIVANTGGFAEIVKHEENGLCFTPGDIADLQRCIIRILDNPEWANEMSQRAQKKVCQDFSWERAAHCTIQVYQECKNFFVK